MEKIDHMLGMTQNMMNITEQHNEMQMMPEMYRMTSVMMGNLNHMKMMHNMNMSMDVSMIDMMESMMRSMEQVMMNMDMNNEMQKKMMMDMMMYMTNMQMSVIMMMKK